MPNLERLDPADEQEWLDEQEERVLDYLEAENIAATGDIEIVWCIAPKIALWHIAPSIWAISGDVPTDFINQQNVNDAKQAMKAIIKRWISVSDYLLRGVQHPTIKVSEGSTQEDMKRLGNLLLRRSELLESWTEDQQKWSQGFS